MANEDNKKKLDALFKQQDDLFSKISKLYEEQSKLYDTAAKGAKDTDGDGHVDIDKNSKEYKEIEKLDEQVEKLMKEVEALDKKIEELGGFTAIDLGGVDSFEINSVDGTEKDDNLTGTDKSDYVMGNAGNDQLSGGKEFDILDGGAGNDALKGGEGDDHLIGGKGNDTMTGGKGKDHFSLSKDSGHDVITDFDPKEDTIDLMAEGIKFSDLKSEKTSDGLKVSWGDNSVLLKGVTATLSEDWFFVGETLVVEPVDGAFEPTDGMIEPGFVGGDMTGGEIKVIKGTDKADKLTGSDGFDDLFGAAGNDELSGGKGADFLFGEAGNDTLTGGEGSDVFFFGKDAGNDTITDFKVGEDSIDLSAAGVEFKDLTVNQENGGTKLSWGDNSVFLQGVTDTASEDWFGLVSIADDAIAIGFTAAG